MKEPLDFNNEKSRYSTFEYRVQCAIVGAWIGATIETLAHIFGYQLIF